MTFEEAGAQFVQLQARWRAGALPPEQYQAMVAQLRVQDPGGWWWQLDPNSGQWMVWNGAQWVFGQQAPQPVPPPQVPRTALPQAAPQPVRQPHVPQPVPRAPQPTAQQSTAAVRAKQAGPGLMEGLIPVLPGIAIDLLQRWPAYRQDPAMLANFAVPSLLPAIVLRLVPVIGRVAAILVVLGCLAWLSWPLIAQSSEILGNAKGVQTHAGRGLVGVSLLYLIPRIWKAGA